ncbi:MAG TPA: SAM-dependent methyltransferase [Saprospiraceae bacterium]|nr:SAM-dependent methyltransferase [Saprospiraceae bacterium]
MEASKETAGFIQAAVAAFENNAIVKLIISKPTAQAGDLKRIDARPVFIAGKPMLSFNFSFTTNDETKNHSSSGIYEVLSQQLGHHFLNAELLTTEGNYSLLFSRKRKARLLHRPPTHEKPAATTHNLPKKRLISAEGNIYLREMGIVSAQGEVTASGQKKFRQIDKYIEIVDSLLRKHPLPRQAHIVDMGAGKGYLTFALYDHLKNNLGMEPQVLGLEIRPHLVEFANHLARQCGFEGLHFQTQDIRDFEGKSTDMLIALHACDTLTDVALAEGIRAGAGIILAAPCCHKQIRQQIQPQGILKTMLRHGILEERQAELLTDSIRSLLLEAEGYQTKVFEFVSIEHTNKNLMIAATRAQPDADARAKVQEIKQMFGISSHFLEQLLEHRNL